jgi:innexin
MLNAFSSLFKFFELSLVETDNFVFRLHYRCTATILLAFTLIVTSFEYIGDPIECIANLKTIPAKTVDLYCWTYSTYSIFNGTKNNSEHPDGLGDDDGPRVYHKYYQWACFIILGQALLFYAPRYAWNNWEGGLLKSLVKDLQNPVLDDNLCNDSAQLLCKYFARNLHNHTTYVFSYVICELMNLLNVSIQLYAMYSFLEGNPFRDSFNIGTLLTGNHHNRTDALAKVREC